MAKTIFRGVSFPFRRSSTEFPASASDDDLIKESLVQLFQTKRGERIMRPAVGSRVLDLVFDPNNEALGDILRAEVQIVVGKYEPRVAIQNVRVERVDSTVIVTIDYVVRATSREGSAAVEIPVPGVT